MATVPIETIHRLEITVQLRGNNAFVRQFEIRGTADNGEEYAASGSIGDDWSVLREVLAEIGRAYPTQAHFRLRVSGKRIVPKT
jgi:hypothetical protein